MPERSILFLFYTSFAQNMCACVPENAGVCTKGVQFVFQPFPHAPFLEPMEPCSQPRKEPQGADVITYNSAISACAKAGKTMLALELLQVLERQRSSPNVISYSSAPWPGHAWT
jgi:pentatricopeptide repeat protein